MSYVFVQHGHSFHLLLVFQLGELDVLLNLEFFGFDDELVEKLHEPFVFGMNSLSFKKLIVS